MKIHQIQNTILITSYSSKQNSSTKHFINKGWNDNELGIILELFAF